MDHEHLRKFLADLGHIFVVYQIEKMQKRKIDPPTAVKQEETAAKDGVLANADDDINPLPRKSDAADQRAL